MNAQDFAVMAAIVGAACAVAGVLGWRLGHERRDVRAVLGTGAALGSAGMAVPGLGGLA